MKHVNSTLMMLVAGFVGFGCESASVDEAESKPVSETPPEAEDRKAAMPAGTAAKTAAPDEQRAKDTTGSEDAPTAIRVEDVGRFRAAPELEESVDHAMRLADANGDGKITRAEANGAMNFVIGGFFFRADENGDGKITPSERKKARSDFSEEHPEVSRMLTTFAQSKAVQTLMERLDTKVPDTIELGQTRETVDDAVDDIFDALDENNDDTITAKEADRGFNVAAAALGKAAFDRADVDSDGMMTFAEFEKSVQGPLKQVFDAADANDDGKLSSNEAASMMSWISQRLDVMAERGYDFVTQRTDIAINR